MNGNDSGAKTVAVLGLGEAGSLLARDLVRGGATVRGWDPDFHGDLREIPRAASFAAAVDGADIVISVNWATVAAEVAREARPLLRRGMLYADHNTAGPKLKEELAAIVEPSGAAFVDVAMMAPVPPLGMRVGMFMAGSGAEELAAYYRRFGTPVGFIGARPGEANARKLTRSVFFKGMSSSVWEALEAARAVGVEDWLRSDIIRTFVEADAATLDRLIDGTAKHAVRRGHEMRDAEAMLRELGTPATMVTATAESLERIAAEQKVAGAPVTAAPAIVLRDVGKVFVRDDGTAVAVLEHVSFEIAAGSFVCIVGRSGSGKSTILNMIAGLIDTSSGAIAFADGVTKRPRLDIGYLTQKETLLPWRDVLHNVAMPLEVRGVGTAQREARARELIRLVGLGDAEKRYPRELSGGMSRRASLARMLASDPATLLLDEPFGALDAQLRGDLQAELQLLWQGSGKTIVFVTHDIDEALLLGDRIIALQSGGRIAVDVNLPPARPRNMRDVRFAPEFIALHERLLDALTTDPGRIGELV